MNMNVILDKNKNNKLAYQNILVSWHIKYFQISANRTPTFADQGTDFVSLHNANIK